MKGIKIIYSAAEMAWLEQNHKMVIGDYSEQFNEKFNRNVSSINLHALRKRNGWRTGRTGCFEKGCNSWNEGKKMPYNANSERTQFKKGRQPHNTNYLGHERVQKDGYIEISVDIENKHTGYERCYVLKHKYLWEKVNGKVKDGMCLKCLDGDRINTDPANWKEISRGMLPALSLKRKYDAAPTEIKPVIMAVTELEHKARQTIA